MKRRRTFFLAVLMMICVIHVNSVFAASGDVVINSKNFPDSVFRSYVKNEIDTNGDGKLSASEIDAVTDMFLISKNISDLTGIRYFKQLERLDCENNRIKSLDLSGLTKLTALGCEMNQLKELDVSKLVNLDFLSCWDNQLTSLDVSKLTSLKGLICSGNPIKSLDLKNLSQLTDLNCSINQLTSLDVSRLTQLKTLACFDNQLIDLDVSGLSQLTELACYGNRLTKLDVSGLNQLNSLNCSKNRLTDLDVSGLTQLTWLECENNYMDSVDKVTGLNDTQVTEDWFTFYPQNENLTADEIELSQCTVTLSQESYVYNGKAKKPGVTVQYNGEKLEKSKYKVSYTNNKNAGVAKVTVKAVKGKGCTGSVTASFTINPNPTALSSVKNSTSKSIQIKWKKNTQATGYEIQYSLDKNFEDAVTTRIKKKSTIKATEYYGASEPPVR